MPLHDRAWAFPLVVLTLSACSGAGVGEPGPEEPAPEPMVPRPSGPEGEPDPGRVTMHRLNRVEYNNTVRDLLSTKLRPADEFPADDRGHGFDNVADVLSLSPLQLELYHRAAEQLIDEALKPGAQRDALVPCDIGAGEPCTRTVLGAFARRAWRRPLLGDELERLLALARDARAQGDTGDEALSSALQAVLVASSFVFRVELDPEPTSTRPHPVGAHELASRLSYFLWSSMPDAPLFAAADSGALLEPATLAEQVTRMLASAKADALVANFAGQWLHVRKIEEHDADRKVFPMFDTALRGAMREETLSLFREVMRGTVALSGLLDADFTHVNDRLAAHYGMPAPGGTKSVRMPVGEAPRGGLLTQGGLLSVTSYPARTSPVQRGHWVMEQLLCTPPPPPPPGVEGLKPEKVATGTLRQRLEQHRSDPACAGCHRVMDPLGFGLEGYDGIGAFRTTDGAFPVDARGQLPDGRHFDGGKALARVLAADPGVRTCTAEKLLTYALGRGPMPGDAQALAAIVTAMGPGARFPDMIQRLVASGPFLRRRGESETAGGSR